MSSHARLADRPQPSAVTDERISCNDAVYRLRAVAGAAGIRFVMPDRAHDAGSLDGRLIAFVRFPQSEGERWASFVRDLETRKIGGGHFTARQVATFLSIFRAASARQPKILRPAVGASNVGVLEASWSFSHLPGRVFTLEIHKNGDLEWFYRDASRSLCLGSDEPVRELPADAMTALVKTFLPASPHAW